MFYIIDNQHFKIKNNQKCVVSCWRKSALTFSSLKIIRSIIKFFYSMRGMIFYFKQVNASERSAEIKKGVLSNKLIIGGYIIY